MQAMHDPLCFESNPSSNVGPVEPPLKLFGDVKTVTLFFSYVQSLFSIGCIVDDAAIDKYFTSGIITVSNGTD
jgi:hypothetical protein